MHGATVDALKVHETRNGARFAVTGARDRSIVLWDIKNVVQNEQDNHTWGTVVPNAHNVCILLYLLIACLQGWVWTVCVGDDDKTVYSCGFDSKLKQWEIVNGSLQVDFKRSISIGFVENQRIRQ